MVSAPSRWRWVIGAAGLCAVYLVVRSIADLHTAFGGGSAVDYLAIASAGRAGPRGLLVRLLRVIPRRRCRRSCSGTRRRRSATFPVPFVNPALLAWLIQPLAVLPLQTGADVFVAMNVVAMALSAAILDEASETASRRPARRLLSLSSLCSHSKPEPGSFSVNRTA